MLSAKYTYIPVVCNIIFTHSYSFKPLPLNVKTSNMTLQWPPTSKPKGKPLEKESGSNTDPLDQTQALATNTSNNTTLECRPTTKPKGTLLEEESETNTDPLDETQALVTNTTTLECRPTSKPKGSTAINVEQHASLKLKCGSVDITFEIAAYEYVHMYTSHQKTVET